MTNLRKSDAQLDEPSEFDDWEPTHPRCYRCGQFLSKSGRMYGDYFWTEVWINPYSGPWGFEANSGFPLGVKWVHYREWRGVVRSPGRRWPQSAKAAA